MCVLLLLRDRGWGIGDSPSGESEWCLGNKDKWAFRRLGTACVKSVWVHHLLWVCLLSWDEANLPRLVRTLDRGFKNSCVPSGRPIFLWIAQVQRKPPNYSCCSPNTSLKSKVVYLRVTIVVFLHCSSSFGGCFIFLLISLKISFKPWKWSWGRSIYIILELVEYKESQTSHQMD